MEKKIQHKESRGLPGGPNEMFTYTTGIFSTEGFRMDSPDVNNYENIIPSGSITMKERDGSPLRKGPIYGVDNLGNQQVMYPGYDYEFPGTQVTERLMAKMGGGLLDKTIKCGNCGWEWKAADGGKDIMSCHKCPGKGLVKAEDGGENEELGCPKGYYWNGTKCVKAVSKQPTYADSLFLYNNSQDLDKWMKQNKYYWKDLTKYNSNRWSDRRTSYDYLKNAHEDEIKVQSRTKPFSAYVKKIGNLIGTSDWIQGGYDDYGLPFTWRHPNIKPQEEGDMIPIGSGNGPFSYSFRYEPIAIKPSKLLTDAEIVKRYKKYGESGIEESRLKKLGLLKDNSTDSPTTRTVYIDCPPGSVSNDEKTEVITYDPDSPGNYLRTITTGCKPEKIENLQLLKPGLIDPTKYQLQGNTLNEEKLELSNEEVESEYLEEGSPDTENAMEWVDKRKYNIDWNGIQIPYRLPRFRKPGSYGDLIKPGKQRYINLPTIESRNTAYLRPKKQDGGENKFDGGGKPCPKGEYWDGTNCVPGINPESDWFKLTDAQKRLLEKGNNLVTVEDWYKQSPGQMEMFKAWIDEHDAETYLNQLDPDSNQSKKFKEALDNDRQWNQEWYTKRKTLPQFKDVAERRLAINNQDMVSSLKDPINLSMDWWKTHPTEYSNVPDVFYAPEIGAITRKNVADYNINQGYTEDNPEGNLLQKSYFRNADGNLQSSLITHEETHVRDHLVPQPNTKKNIKNNAWGQPGTLDPIEQIITSEEALADPRNQGYNNAYQQQPTEVRARLNVWRMKNGISPLKNYTEEELKSIIEKDLQDPNLDHNIKELYETIKNDPSKLKFVHDSYVSNDSNKDLDTAEYGGENENPPDKVQDLNEVTVYGNQEKIKLQGSLIDRLTQYKKAYNDHRVNLGLEKQRQSAEGTSSIISLKDQIQSYKKELDEEKKSYDKASKALNVLKKYNPESYKKAKVSDVLNATGVDDLRNLYKEGKISDATFMDFYDNFGKLYDREATRTTEEDQLKLEDSWYGQPDEEGRTRWMDNPNNVSKVAQNVAIGAPLAAAYPIMAPAIGATLANPYVAGGLNAYFAGHGLKEFGNEDSHTRKSMSRAYDDPTGSNIGDAAWDVSMNSLNFVGLPFSKAFQGSKNVIKGYKEIPKQLPGSPNVDFSKYLTQEEAVAARSERLISQKNKLGWNEQLTPELEQRLSNAVKNHNPASDYAGERLGANTMGRTATEVSKDAISKQGIPLNEANKARIAAHEVGHYYANSPAEGKEWASHFDFSKLSQRSRDYLMGKGWKGRNTDYANEVRERAAQLKDYIAQKNGIPLNQDFEITQVQLDDAIKNYIKDTGLDNTMSEMLGALKNKKGFLKTMNKFALGTISAVIGAETLQQKKQGGATNDYVNDLTPEEIQKYIDGGEPIAQIDAANTVVPSPLIEYVVRKGDTLSKIASENNTSISSIMKNNEGITDPNVIRINQKISLVGKSPDAPQEEVYKDWNTIRDKKDRINKLSDEQKIVSFYNDKPEESYLIVDKKNAVMKLYTGGNLTKSFEVGVGQNPGDAQTVTKVKNGKTDWSAGNKSTGAGIYTISNINPASEEYYNEPSFNLKNENGIEVSTTIHGTPKPRMVKFNNGTVVDNRMTNGCINGKCEDLKELYGQLDLNTKVYILPEDLGNSFQIIDGKPALKVSSQNRVKYNSYVDQTGTKQKGQGANQTTNTLVYKPVKAVLNEAKFKEDVFQWNDFNDEKEYTSTTKPFVAALSSNKRDVMKAAKISSDVYNELAKMAFGIYGTESNYGDTHSAVGNLARATNKVLDPKSASSPDYKSKYETYGADEKTRSVGLTQIRWNYLNEDEKKALKQVGITSNKDFLDPKKAAIGTVTILGIRYNQQLNDKQKQDLWKYLPTKWNNRSNYGARVKSNSSYLSFKQLDKKQDGGEPDETSWTAYLNPANWGTYRYDEHANFKKAFRAARNDGESDFLWHGTRYTTELKKPESAAPVKKPKGITPELLIRQAYRESAFNPNAVSPAGYKGIGQIGEDVIKDYKKANNITGNIDPFNIKQNSDVQKYSMNELYNSSFINKPNQSEQVRLAKTLASYNWGRGNVANLLNDLKEEGVDIYNSLDWINKLPDEPKNYINDILFKKNTTFNNDFSKALSDQKNKPIKSLYGLRNGGESKPGPLMIAYNRLPKEKKMGGAIINRKEFGGQLNSGNITMYKDYIKGNIGNEIEVVKNYDKLNRMYYSKAKELGMTAANYIMTYIVGNS